jgi:hypothetical protein
MGRLPAAPEQGVAPCGTIQLDMPNSSSPDASRTALSRRDAEPTRAQLSAGAATFALLASPPRLHLVWLITHGAYDVGTLATRVGISIATVRREGRRHFYTVDDPHVLTLVEQIFDHIAPDGSLAPDPPPTAP